MKITLLLKLQLSYLLLGVSYNLISLGMMHFGAGPLSSTSSVTGIAVLLLYGFFLIAGYLKRHTIYRILMFIAFLVLGYGGVMTHILNFSHMHLYYSFTAWIIAILINLFGLYLNYIAFTGKYSKQINLSLTS